MRRAINGYYFTRKPVTVDGVKTYAVVERDDSGKFWWLRLESWPEWRETAQTKRAAMALLDIIVRDGLAVATF